MMLRLMGTDKLAYAASYVEQIVSSVYSSAITSSTIAHVTAVVLQGLVDNTTPSAEL